MSGLYGDAPVKGMQCGKCQYRFTYAEASDVGPFSVFKTSVVCPNCEVWLQNAPRTQSLYFLAGGAILVTVLIVLEFTAVWDTSYVSVILGVVGLYALFSYLRIKDGYIQMVVDVSKDTEKANL